MLRPKTLLVILAALAALPVAGQVVGIRSAPFYRFVPCPRLTKPVKVDGNLKEWDLSKATIVLNAQSLKTWGEYNPSVDGDQDASARALVAWDDQGMYFVADVTDDKVVGLEADPRPAAIWVRDGFMLMFFPTPALLDLAQPATTQKAVQ